MKGLTKIIRIVTVAPVIAFLMLLTLYLRNAPLFGSRIHFLLAVLFLVIFPLLAYPLQPFIKKYKEKGREGQRALAINFAVAGYVGSCLSALALKAPRSVRVIYLTYLLSGVLILLSNKLLHFRASGHACGVAGPCAILVCFGEPAGYWGIPILALAWLSSLSMKRHTAAQLLGGTLIPIAALAIVISV